MQGLLVPGIPIKNHGRECFFGAEHHPGSQRVPPIQAGKMLFAGGAAESEE